MKKRQSKGKIVLIYPVISPEIQHHWMPTSLLAVSSKLDNMGYDIRIIDQRVFEKKAFTARVLEETCDALVAGISVMTGYQIHGAAMISREIKSVYPGVPVVWGGDHPTVASEQVMELPFVDMAVRGQGEETLYEIVTRIARQEELKGIHGLDYKMDTHICKGAPRKRHGIDAYYPLPYHLLDVKAYINPRTMAFNYYTSSGCAPGKCRFCNTGSSYKGWRAVSPRTVVQQVKSLVDTYGFRNCMFQDSNFFVSEKRVVEICQRLLDEGVHIKWNGSGRADQLLKYADDTFELMVASGCICVFIGVESGSQRMLDRMDKRESAECMIRLSEKIKRFPIDLHISLIFALPGETVEDLMITAEYINHLKAINARIREQKCFFTPYPGTPLYEEVVSMGYEPPENAYGWIGVEQPSGFVDVPWMAEEIKKTYRAVFEENFKAHTRTAF